MLKNGDKTALQSNIIMPDKRTPTEKRSNVAKHSVTGINLHWHLGQQDATQNIPSVK